MENIRLRASNKTVGPGKKIINVGPTFIPEYIVVRQILISTASNREIPTEQILS